MIGMKRVVRSDTWGIGAAAMWVGLVAVSLPAAPIARAQSAHDLVRDVIYNEVNDRARDSFWEYRIEKNTATEATVSEQVETKLGPIHRLISKDNQPLSSVQQREENARLEQLLQSPSEQARVEQQYEQDEARLQRLMKLMPDAFLYDFDGPQTGDVVRLRFRPDPDFKPPTYEARVFHALAGTLLIAARQKRMTHLQGEIVDRVDFGWGLLGHIEKGGTFEIQRRPVNASHWKTEMVDVHIQGKVILFKTVAQNQHEVRSGFKPVPLDITLTQAKEILDRVGNESTRAQGGKPGSGLR